MEINDLKLLALDLDGTLLNNAGRFSELSERVLNYLLNHGVTLLLVTGRGYLDATPAFMKTKFLIKHKNLYLSGYNGAQLKKQIDGATVYLKTIDSAKVKRDIAMIGEKYRQVGIVAFGYVDVNCEQTIAARSANVDESMIANLLDEYAFIRKSILNERFSLASLDQVEQMRVMKLSLCADQQTITELRTTLLSQYATTLEPGIFDKNLFVSELSDLTVNKAKPIAYLANLLACNVAKQVICFGNESNDVPMLKTVNHSVAMANARYVIKPNAHFVSAYDNNHDGVARWLIDYFHLVL